MRKISNNEMSNINGGASVTSAFNTVLKAISTLFTVGQAVGSAIRRATSGSYCKA